MKICGYFFFGSRNERSTVSFTSVETGWSHHSHRIAFVVVPAAFFWMFRGELTEP